MKSKQFFGILLLLVGTILLGCRTAPDYPYGFMYEHHIYIDSTASACGIDSCVVSLTWLNEKINAFLADSTRRKNEFVSSLDIDMITYVYPDSPEKYTCFKCVCSDDTPYKILWLGCESDTICMWDDNDSIETDTAFIIDCDNYLDYMLRINRVYSEQVVRIDLGLIPKI